MIKISDIKTDQTIINMKKIFRRTLAFFVPGESKKVHAFGGTWNEKYVVYIQNYNVNLSIKG